MHAFSINDVSGFQLPVMPEISSSPHCCALRIFSDLAQIFSSEQLMPSDIDGSTIVRDFDDCKSVTAQQAFLSTLVVQAIGPIIRHISLRSTHDFQQLLISAAMRI